jgi:hypothetical protein
MLSTKTNITHRWCTVLLSSLCASVVQPHAAMRECSAGMTDVTWLENVSPSYCSNTQDPELVAEFNFFTTVGAGLIAPAGTPQVQLTDQVVTVTLASGRSFTVDSSLVMSSGNGDTSFTEMRSWISKCR